MKTNAEILGFAFLASVAARPVEGAEGVTVVVLPEPNGRAASQPQAGTRDGVTVVVLPEPEPRQRSFEPHLGADVTVVTLPDPNAERTESAPAEPAPTPEPPAPSLAQSPGLPGCPPPELVAAPPSSPPAGQWVYTDQYSWVFMPYGEAYTSVPPGDSGEPYMYLYSAAYGWTWFAAPWVWGWGPWPYFGTRGPWSFAWYAHGWWRNPGRWHFGPAQATLPARSGFPALRGSRPVFRGGGALGRGSFDRAAFAPSRGAASFRGGFVSRTTFRGSGLGGPRRR